MMTNNIAQQSGSCADRPGEDRGLLHIGGRMGSDPVDPYTGDRDRRWPEAHNSAPREVFLDRSNSEIAG